MASTTSRIAQLASTISSNTAIFDQYFADNALPTPSFAADGPLFDDPFPPSVEAARLEILNATLELRELTQGPRALLMCISSNFRVDSNLLYRQKLASKIPLDDPDGVAYAELSSQIGINQDALTRVLRALILHRVFAEPTPGRIAHSAASRLLATDSLMDDWLGTGIEDVRAATLHLASALEKFPASDEPTETGIGLASQEHDSQPLESFYGLLAKAPERARRFAATMSLFQKGDSFSLRHLVDGFPWADLPEGARVVDLGGSTGNAAIAVASRFPQLKFTVQDLSSTIAAAPPVPVGLNIELVVHDILQPQPVKGAAVYLFRWILHNWPDKYAIRILQSLIPALTTGARILLMDAVTPPFGSLPNTIERDARHKDLLMLSLFNAKDREASEWEMLFQHADKGFKFLGITQMKGSALSFIEAEWEG